MFQLRSRTICPPQLTVDCNKRFEGNTVVKMVCEAGKGWSGEDELKKQQDGQCSFGYVAPADNTTTNSTDTDKKDKKTGELNLKDKSNSQGSKSLSFLQLAPFIFLFFIHIPMC